MPSLKSDAILERLLALHPKLIDLSLDRMERLLAALGNPERHTPPVVHVAGTNGKGSTIAFMRAALEAAGPRVHAYTSPHLTRFHERIRLAGALITEDDLEALLEDCETANGGAPITYFESTTAAAFLAFSQVEADVLLLETGLGGRLDATNVIGRPALTVITPVSIDHTQYLGEGLAVIAGEKAGILKASVTGVIGPQPNPAAEVIAARAAAIGAPLLWHGEHYGFEATAYGLRYKSGDVVLDLPRPGLFGAYQVDNAALAVAAVGALPGFAVDATALAQGLTRVEWPARLQRLDGGPLVDRLPESWELWLDAGHNPHAGDALAEAMAEWHDRPLHLIAGMLNSKDVVGYLQPLAAVATDARCIAIPGEAASLPAADLAAAARQAGLAATVVGGVEAAMNDILAGGAAPGRILICGSHYLVGALLAENR
ncbi:MAG: folylpolyglutamate synthase/dihydrofolate synthase family protein [Pseudomonadota bacterium]|nr:folylpolyglutamate synthase/dihydrofolate synthase family protein [Pseudomonadota bacterium]